MKEDDIEVFLGFRPAKKEPCDRDQVFTMTLVYSLPKFVFRLGHCGLEACALGQSKCGV